jgi:hypothetical protein
MLRVDELTVGSECAKNQTLTVNNVSVSNGILEIYLGTSKIDQFGSGTILQICPQENQEVCPVFALLHYVKVLYFVIFLADHCQSINFQLC